MDKKHNKFLRMGLYNHYDVSYQSCQDNRYALEEAQIGPQPSKYSSRVSIHHPNRSLGAPIQKSAHSAKIACIGSRTSCNPRFQAKCYAVVLYENRTGLWECLKLLLSYLKLFVRCPFQKHEGGFCHVSSHLG